MVCGVQAQIVDLQRAKGLVRHVLGNYAVGPHLGEVPDPAEHPVGNTGRAPGPPGNLIGSLRNHIYI